MNTITLSPALTENSTDISKWFDGFVAAIRADELQLVSGVADNKKREFWKPFLENNSLVIGARSRESGSMLIIPDLVADYLYKIRAQKIELVSLSLQLSDSKILVWAVVNDEDEQAMDQLFLQEAAINAKYGDYGFHISTTIVEKSDNCQTPSQFQPVM
ncbi:MAG: hypothetical protein WCP85_31245 [Mariniphaga sp.]